VGDFELDEDEDDNDELLLLCELCDEELLEDELEELLLLRPRRAGAHHLSPLNPAPILIFGLYLSTVIAKEDLSTICL